MPRLPYLIRSRAMCALCGRRLWFCGFESQIHTNEIGQAALTKSMTTVRILSPAGPAPIQIGFQVIALHTPTVTNVEIAILPTLQSNEVSVREGPLLAARCVSTRMRHTA
jgi:hypothetical protein